MERLFGNREATEYLDIVGRRGQVGHFRPEQIAQRSTWAQVPNEYANFAAMHVIRMVPDNHSTLTWINPLDPVDGAGFCEHSECGCEHTIAAGRC